MLLVDPLPPAPLPGWWIAGVAASHFSQNPPVVDLTVAHHQDCNAGQRRQQGSQHDLQVRHRVQTSHQRHVTT